MSYTKSDITKNIALETSLSIESSKKILDSFIKLVVSRSKDSRLKISSFGTFHKKKTPARVGRNPKTGQEYIIKEREKIRFYPSSKIKKFVN